jgi:superfamily I DNA and/or RNA helicase
MIPNLLTQLKPCLLMSPISVSQFLDPEKTKFDLVIFDEASQLRSEDAICSVYRGKQLVVCGDNKQLPPTTFFEQGMSDDLPDDDTSANEAFDVFDSVLDACAAVMPQRQMPPSARSSGLRPVDQE